MGKPAARVTDNHVCPMVTGIVPHVGGPILPPCAPTVLTMSLPQARVGDMLTCVGPPDVIALGSFTVLTMGQPSARIADMTVHGGTIVMGAPTVLIGDVGFGSVAPGAFKQLVPKLGIEGASGNAAQMAQAMIAAAKDGKPFCEQCMKSAAG
jgi:uncharacterized Zn-binding protein involved in type VI secretion